MARRGRLAEKRQAEGYSQESLAHELGVSRNTVQRWEDGTTTPYPRQRTPLAAALNVTLSHLDDLLVPDDHVEPSDTGPSLERQRELVARLLAGGTVSAATVEEMADAVHRRSLECLTTPPNRMVDLLVADVADLSEVASHRQPLPIHRRITELIAQLGALIGVEMMVLGLAGRSRSWYRLASTAAVDADVGFLVGHISAFAATVPLYFGDAHEAVHLARQAQQRCTAGTATAALAPALESVGLAQLGEPASASGRLRAARSALDALPDHDGGVFGFTERRLAFYESRAMSEAAQHRPEPAFIDKALAAQGRALSLYPAGAVGDPALVRLDRAACLARAGDVAAGAQEAEAALAEMPAEHRTPIFTGHAAAQLLR